MKSIKYSVLLLGTLLMCLNNGYTQWVSQNSGTNNDLFGVWFTDDTTGFVAGSIPGGCILQTTDAGATWSTQTYPEVNVGCYPYDVRFSDAMNGWVVGACDSILHTKDGGITWNTKYIVDSTSLYSIFCLDSNTLWLAGGSYKNWLAATYYTTNGGDTWTEKLLEIRTAIFRIFFINADTGIAVGGMCVGCYHVKPDSGGYILRTTNGGETWTILEHYEDLIGLNGVFFTDANTGTVVGTGGTILRTTDGGDTWIDQSNETWPELWDVFFISADTGFVVGGNWSAHNKGIILRTTDGGTTWTEQNIPTDMPLLRVFFINDTIGIAVGNDGTILRTTNGLTWIDEKQLDRMTWNSSLSESYPNPFNLETNIKFQIQGFNNVTIKIYTVHGHEVATLINEKMVPGNYEITWDARDFPEGVYFYRLKVGTYVEASKLVLIR
jgi:photosystem II stability/assembly factor-like uncharacterized protein